MNQIRQLWHLAGYVSTENCADIIGCRYIYEPDRSINSKWQFWVVPLFNSVSDILNILHSVYRISCCPHADLILPKLSAPHRRLSRLALQGNAYVVCHKCRVSRHAQLCIGAAIVVTLLGPVEEFTAKDSPDSVYLANP